jgi:beta-phosphoglucomutase family hydrolase
VILADLFDLDGVLTDTASLHALAWKRTFDAIVDEPFDLVHDYARYVDGREREDGVRTFLASRGIELPESEVRAVGDRKNALVLQLIRRHGVTLFPDALAYLRSARARGLATAVVSSSTNCRGVLDAAGIERLFDVRVDALDARAEGLAGKPAPDMFLAAARRLGVDPGAAAVFEDAIAGVEAGHAGHFGYVVGVARTVPRHVLLEHGADIAVADLTELLAVA